MNSAAVLRGEIRRLESAVALLERRAAAKIQKGFRIYRQPKSDDLDKIRLEVNNSVVFKLKGLKQKPELNGQHIVLAGWSAKKSRWQVSIDCKEPFLVRPENIHIVEPDFPLHPVEPPHGLIEIRSHPTLRGQKGVFASRGIAAGCVIIVETPLLKVTSDSYASLVREYFNLSSDDRTQALELYAESTLNLQKGSGLNYNFNQQVPSARLSDTNILTCLQN